MKAQRNAGSTARKDRTTGRTEHLSAPAVDNATDAIGGAPSTHTGDVRHRDDIDRHDTGSITDDAPASPAPPTNDLALSSAGEEDSAAVQRGEGAADRRVEVPFVLASDICVLKFPASRQAASPPKGDLDEPEASRTTAEAAETLPTFATVDEIADLLRLERKAVYRLAQRGELPGCRRLGHSFRVHVPSVLSWFQAGQRRDRKREKTS